MERISSSRVVIPRPGASSTASGRRCWRDDETTIFLGMAGVLSAGGLRLVIAHLIANRYVDCLVSTGANLYHDLHETRGQRHYVGSPQADDAAWRRIASIASTTRTPTKKSSSRTTSGLPCT